jgi:hypothetical protein
LGRPLFYVKLLRANPGTWGWYAQNNGVMKKLTIPLVVVILVAGACLSLGGSEELSEMEIRAQSGSVLIHRGDEDPIEVGDEAVPLEVSDVVETGKRGHALLRLADDRDIRMQSNSEIVIDSTRAVTSERGSVLIDAPVRTKVVVDEVEATSSGSQFRVDSGFGSTRIGSYSGNVALSSPGQTPVQIGRLFQATVAAGDLGDEEPYRLDTNDPWDLDVLEDVVEMENELDLLAQGFTRQLGNDRPDVAYFRALAGGKNVSFVSKYLKRRPVDLLIGFTIAEHAQKPRALKGAFRKAFRVRDDGATWGVAAAILRADPRPVVAQLEDAILGTGVVADGGTSDEAEFSVAAAQATDDNAPISQPRSGDGGGDQPPIAGEPGEEDPGGGGGEEDPGDGGGGNEEEEDCEDIECVVRRAVSPSPSPTGVLDGTVDIGGRGAYVPLSL